MKKEKPSPAGFSHAKTPPVDVGGKVRVYIDLPADLVRKLNVLAAMRSQSKRVLLADLVREAVAAAKL